MPGEGGTRTVWVCRFYDAFPIHAGKGYVPRDLQLRNSSDVAEYTYLKPYGSLNYQSEQNLVRYDRSSTSITADLCAYCFLTSSRSKAWEGPEWQSWWRTWNREGVISTTRVSLLHYVSVFLQSRTRWVFWQIYVTGFLTPVEIVEFYWQVISARTPVCYQIPCQSITNTYSFACRCSITRHSSC